MTGRPGNSTLLGPEETDSDRRWHWRASATRPAWEGQGDGCALGLLPATMALDRVKMSPKRFLMAFPRRVRAENATFVVESIKALGLPVPAGSRVMQMYRTLTDESRPMIRPTDPDFETAVEAERDLQVLAFVFDVAAAHPTDQKFRDLIRFALGDSVLPQDNRGNSRGRDFQFELFIAAICQNAGLTPIEREEPDVTCVVEGVNYGIAAKRIKGVGNLHKRISKAANQIEKAGLPGIIVLETTLLFNPNNTRITKPMSDNDFGKLHHQALCRCIGRYADQIHGWVRDKGVCGLVFHDQQVRLDLSGNWFLEGMNLKFPLTHHRREFHCFADGYFAGLPNRVN